MVNIIPRCRDYPAFKSRAGGLYRDFERLKTVILLVGIPPFDKAKLFILTQDLENEIGYYSIVRAKIIENNRISRVSAQLLAEPEPLPLVVPLFPLPEPWWPSEMPAETGRLPAPPFLEMGMMSTRAVGLCNSGNLCYMNAILQCMSGTIPLSRYFLDGSYKSAITPESTKKHLGGFTAAFAETVKRQWDGKQTEVWPEAIKVFCSYDITMRLKLIFILQFVAGALKGVFADGGQHDAQEFLEFLLDQMDDDLNLLAADRAPDDPKASEATGKESQPLPAPPTMQLPRGTQSYSVVSQWFQGKLNSSVSCLECKKTSTTNDNFMCLSLPIPAGGMGGLQLDYCLQAFFGVEGLGEEIGWLCSGCRLVSEATKKSSIAQLPHILVIHLKRFAKGDRGGAKITTLVDTPFRLDVTRYLSTSLARGVHRPPFYHLYATCNHFGTLTGGHYTAVVRNASTGGWDKFDDHEVTQIGGEQVVVSLFMSS